MIFRKISFLIISIFFFPPLLQRGIGLTILSALILASGGKALAQISTTSDTSKMDTIFFLNGEVRAIKVVDTVSHLIRFLPEKRKKKPHVFDVEKDRVFSVKFSNGQERIIYFHEIGRAH